MGEGTENRQERNIMILFLSNLHGDWLKQKDKDTGKEKRTNIMQDNKEEKLYTICAPEKALCKETNEAPMADVLASLGKPLDAIFYFSTKQVGMYPPPKGKALGKHITVLFPPAFNIPKEYDSEAHFFWTERAPKVLGDKFTDTTKIFPVAFDESATNPMESIIVSVTAMEQAIRLYLAQEKVLEQGEKPLKHCHLYVDVTGGLRTASMVMSAVMQLLVYQDAKLERVVYSDGQAHCVSNVQPISDMYKLVAGVDAFKKYGSSAALDEYFKDVKAEYEPLGNLLDAMNDFSESVLLCQTDAIKKDLKELMLKLHDFEKDQGVERPAKAELLARMTDELKYVYGKLFSKDSGEPDDIEIIQWCTDNSLIQQALTLCTEWMPGYLINHGAVYTDKLEVQKACLEMKESDTSTSKKTDKFGKNYYVMKFLIHSKPMARKATRRSPLQATGEILREIEERSGLWQGKSSKNAVSQGRTRMRWGMLDSDISSEEALEYIRGYAYIRGDLRNKINHATKDAKSINLESVREEIDQYLILLRKIRGRKHVCKYLWAEDAKETKP